jgi:hypothetical protein
MRVDGIQSPLQKLHISYFRLQLLLLIYLTIDHILYSKTGFSKEMADTNLSPLCTGVLLTSKVAMSSGSCVEQHSLDMTGKKSGLQVMLLIFSLHCLRA